MPKRVKTIDLTKLSPTCNKISFEINKLDALHLEIKTGEVIKSDTRVELFIMKPNNQLVSETITTISDSTVKIDVKNGALDVAGTAIGRIKLSDSDGIVSTAPFYFTINDSFTNDEAIINSVGTEIFENLLNRLEIVENSAQVAQIKANKTNIATLKGVVGDSSSGLVKAVTDNASQLGTKASKDDVARISSGTPLFASSTTEMTDTTKNYVNTTDGYLYIYSGGSWVKTTVQYQSTGIEEGSIGTRGISKSLRKAIGVRVVDFTTVGGYINNNHAFVSNGGFNTTSPIYLKKGEEIYFKTNAIANNMYVLSVTDSESTVYRDGILCTTSGLKEYTYTAKEDCYIVISGALKSISVDNIVTDNIRTAINELINKKDTFTVGNSETADYSSLMECFTNLKNNDSKKTIYIEDGTYDIFAEIGGSAFAKGITSTDKFEDVSIFVPDNTTLIGLGNVVLNFLPEQNDVNDVSAYLLSPINVRGNIHMKNIKINCKNCRYGIHDETSGISKYDNGEHIYENVEIHYLPSNYYNGPGGNPFGCGFSSGMDYKFNHCIFDSQYRNSALLMHNGNNSSKSNNIAIENCIFKSDWNYHNISFLNTASVQLYNNVYISSSSIRDIRLGKNTPAENLVNAFKLYINNCNAINIETLTAVNALEPEIYNVIPNSQS